MRKKIEPKGQDKKKNPTKKNDPKRIAGFILLFVFISLVVFVLMSNANNQIVNEKGSRRFSSQAQNNQDEQNNFVLLSPIDEIFIDSDDSQSNPKYNVENFVYITESVYPKNITVKKGSVIYFVNLTDDVFLLEFSSGDKLAVKPGQKDYLKFFTEGEYSYYKSNDKENKFYHGKIIVV